MDVVRNKKAWLRLMEVALAAGLIFAFIIYMQGSQKGLKTDTIDWSRNSLQDSGEALLDALWVLNTDGDNYPDLKYYIINSDWTSAGDLFSSQLPPNIGYAMYQYTGGSYSFKAGSTPPQEQVESVSIIKQMSGSNGQFCGQASPCAIQVVLWYKQ